MSQQTLGRLPVFLGQRPGPRSAHGGGPPFITSVDASGRFLVDQYSNPYLMRGCSPWLMMTYLTTSTLMEQFFALRQGHGFNTAIVTLFPSLVFEGRNGDTIDDVYPFTGQPATIDVTTPNETYWARVDTMFSLAEQYGFTVLATAADWWGWADDVGNNTAFSTQGTAGWETFGEFIGTRYGNRPNIVWLLGHDYNFTEWAANNQWFTAILTGLGNVSDTNLVTLHNLREPSRENTNMVSSIDFDLTYNYVSMSAQVLGEYALTSPVMPVVHGESQYEGENNDGMLPANADDRCVRIQLLWTLTCGAMGSFIGHTDEWKFGSGWATSIDSVAAAQVKMLFDWWETLAWHTLIPDSGSSLLTAGRGTYNTAPFTSTYAGVVRNTTGTTPASVAVLFIPTARTVTLDETKIAGTLTAAWKDPASGAEQAATGSAGDYTTPGNNSAGDPDWLLVLEGSG